MKKISYTVQGLLLHRVSLVCVMCTLLLCFDYSSPQVSHLQRISLTVGEECLDFIQCVVSFNSVCSGLLVK